MVDGNTNTILNNVSLDIDRGEVVGLVGQTGSGKSMLGWAIIDLLPRSCYVSKGTTFYNQIPISETSNLSLIHI